MNKRIIIKRPIKSGLVMESNVINLVKNLKQFVFI